MENNVTLTIDEQAACLDDKRCWEYLSREKQSETIIR